MAVLVAVVLQYILKQMSVLSKFRPAGISFRVPWNVTLRLQAICLERSLNPDEYNRAIHETDEILYPKFFFTT